MFWTGVAPAVPGIRLSRSMPDVPAATARADHRVPVLACAHGQEQVPALVRQFKSGDAVDQHQAGEPLVPPDDVAAAADHDHRQVAGLGPGDALLHLRRAPDVGEIGRPAAQAHRRVVAERDSLLNVQRCDAGYPLPVRSVCCAVYVQPLRFHVGAAGSCPAPAPAPLPRRASGQRRRGQDERKRGTLPHPALAGDPPAVERRDAGGDGQSQTGPAAAPGTGAVRAVHGREEVRQLLRAGCPPRCRPRRCTPPRRGGPR